MFALSVLDLAVPLLLVAGVVALALRLSARPDGSLSSELVAARRHAVRTSTLAVLAAVVAVPVVGLVLGVTDAGVAGPVLGCLPLVGAVAGLLVLLVGELTWPRQHGLTRTALLHDRSTRTVLEGAWPRAAGIALALLALTGIAGGLLADGTGRGVSHASTDPSGALVLRTHTPFPGWAYGGPQVATAALALVVLALVAVATARRATVVTADLDTDRLLRRASVARACRLLVAGALLTAGPDLVLGGLGAAGVVDGGAVLVARLVGVAGGLVVVAALAALVVPVPRLPAAASPAGPPSSSVRA